VFVAVASEEKASGPVELEGAFHRTSLKGHRVPEYRGVLVFGQLSHREDPVFGLPFPVTNPPFRRQGRPEIGGGERGEIRREKDGRAKQKGG